MSYHPGARTSGLRWREDVGIERRCDYCPKAMQWWPLTREFWDFASTFVRCRACRDASKRRSSRERYKNPKVRLLALEHAKQYGASAAEVKAIKQRARYWADPERYRAAARERYVRNRERILARRKFEYWSEKAA